jgi:hypothetical protein
MGYKEDLRKINAVLRDPNSRCYDPLAGRSLINIQERRVANQRRLKRTRAVRRWRRRNRIRYRAYMREYMAKRRAERAADAGSNGFAAMREAPGNVTLTALSVAERSAILENANNSIDI